MNPFLLSPSCKDSIWGGTRLKTLFGKEHAAPVISECWELSVHPAGLSAIASGPFAGQKLADFAGDPDIIGLRAAQKELFPFMLKWIDSAKPLSIQVHPDDTYAKKHENDAGKTEMWYIVDCDEDSYIYYGFKTEITPDELAAYIQNNTILDFLQKVPVKKGDCFFIPAGTVHAIGPGILLAEVQQSSNVTYRLYDYARLDTDGKLRPLHIQKAAAVADLHPPRPQPPCDLPVYYTEGELLAACPSFAAVLACIDTHKTYTGDRATFHAFMFLHGTGQLVLPGETVPLHAGETIFIPANAGDFAITGPLTFLDVFVPDPAYL